MDSKLSWSPDDYDNITLLRLDNNMIWLPDILVYNSANGGKTDYISKTPCLVRASGSVTWVPPTRLRSYCNLDLRLWPFDEQHCVITIGSWTYDANDLNITKYSADSTDLSFDNNEWILMESEVDRIERYNRSGVVPYVTIDYKFRLVRRSHFYWALIISPVTVVMLLSLTSFWLPAAAVEKVLLNGVNVLICVSYLLYVARCFTKLGSHTPYVGEFVRVVWLVIFKEHDK